jgi:hypothetical protein
VRELAQRAHARGGDAGVVERLLPLDCVALCRPRSVEPSAALEALLALVRAEVKAMFQDR